jgi:uncharacterized damage-inducible protein DinB
MDRSLESTVLHIVRTRLVKEYPAQINFCLDLLTDDEIWWRPNDQANAVANLVVHLSWSNRYYLEEVIAERGIGRNRDEEFSARGSMTKGQVRETWDHACRTVQQILDGIDPSLLTQSTDRTGKQTTYGQILLHVSHHNAAHMGQIVWITKMLHAGAVHELWRKVRSG